MSRGTERSAPYFLCAVLFLCSDYNYSTVH